MRGDADDATTLPIEAVVPRVRAALARGRELVLVAPPGAGKTTRLPLALFGEAWAAGRRILVVEPRRLAARAAAARMAATLGEPLGRRIGLRARFERDAAGGTAVEVVTEGVFVRLILDDPALDGVAAVLFDEFHERALGADLGLALALDARALRPDLRIAVMSATLDGARVARLLGEATPVIESAGRAFPVDTRYLGRDPTERIEDAVTRAILRALAEETGSILAFLPGQAEIGRVAERLAARHLPPDVAVAPLFAAMDRRAQDAAVAPVAPGRRKVVLATSVAETALTIDGVRVVIDSGLARVPRYEPALGLTRLETQRVSRAAADQRRGRAGRTEPGLCLRLWEEAGTGALEPFARPAILSADLTGLLLDCAHWGARRPERDLAWLDPPPAPALAEARNTLHAIAALDADGGLTPEGAAIRALPLPPRLARMVVRAANSGDAVLAAEIATVIVERGLGGPSPDLRERIGRFRRETGSRAAEARDLARGFARDAGGGGQASGDPEACGRLLSLAFPDRIAKARGKPGEFLMANGRAAALEPHEALAAVPFLAVAEVTGRAGASRILLAAPLAETDVLAADGVADTDELRFDPARAALTARRTRRLGALVLADAQRPVPTTAEAAAVLAAGLVGLGLGRLPWTAELAQWRDRVRFLRAAAGEPWPDLSDETLAADGAPWLAARLDGVPSLAALGGERLGWALQALLPWDLARRLDIEAPSHFTTPAGATHRLDYAAAQGPTVTVRVQELFGLSVHPVLAGVPLVLELVSPGGKPVQITRDLPGFWAGSWKDVRAAMRGRYPKHPWPEDPAAAAPTLRAKPRA